MKNNLKRIVCFVLTLCLVIGILLGHSFPAEAASTPGKVGSLTVAASYNQAKVSWNKVKGATSYEVYQSKSKQGSYKKICSVKTNSATLKKLTTDQAYYVKVRAVKGKKKGAFSSIKGFTPRLAAPSVMTKVANKSDAVISWKKVAGATSYQIYRSTRSNAGYKLIGTVKNLSYTNKNLNNGTYYYKVKAVRGKSSRLSAAKPVKITKHKHSYKASVKTKATCTAGGIIKYRCVCGDEKYEQVKAAGHTYGKAKVTKEPTCKEDGIKTYTCSKCHHTKTETIKSAGHVYDEGVITKQPTVENEGYITYSCTKCSKVKIDRLAKLAQPAPESETETENKPTPETENGGAGEAHQHAYSSSVTTKATCEKDGVKTYVCECGESYTEAIKAAGHKWDQGKVTKEATCTADGVRTYTCTVCGKTRQETIKAAGHSYIEKIETQPACDCTGYKTYTCSRCGDSYGEEMPVIEHKYSDNYTVVKEPTCISEGLGSYVCEYCGYDIVKILPKLTHEFESTLVSGATCEKAGQVKYECKHCHTSYTETDKDAYPALGHKMAVTDSKKATCEEDGYETSTCSRCGKSSTKTIKAAGHHYDTGIIQQDATCAADGDKVYTCSICGDKKHEVIPALGHNYKKTAVLREATCKTGGLEEYTCDRCGDTYTSETAVDTSTHKWEPVTEHRWVVDKEAYDERVKVGIRYGFQCFRCKAAGIETIYWDDETYDIYCEFFDKQYQQQSAGSAISYHILDCCAMGDQSGKYSYGNISKAIWETVHHEEEGHYQDVITGYKCITCGTENN